MEERLIPLAQLLRRHRQASGLTQEALAERAQLSVRAVRYLERGLIHRPHRDTLELLADALALSPAERAQFTAAAWRSRVPAPSAQGSQTNEEKESAPAAGGHLTNLTPALTSFIGRAAEQTAVSALLREGRLLTLTGAGGCGKTRLALHVAQGMLGTYPHGVWVVELAPLADAALVPRAVAGVLGVRDDPSRSLPETLVEALRGRRLLLVLDNCEHLAAACAALATTLLQGCPDVQILATSREALGVAGERVWRVPSLSLPAAGRASLEQLGEAEAVQLFVERAQAVRPAFGLTEQNMAGVVQVCERLDGMPLALELAAARLGALTMDSLAARLDDRFRILAGGPRTALPRQQTLRATLDWSYDLLTETERLLLRRLAVFAGGWTLEAAEAVCADPASARSSDGEEGTPGVPPDRAPSPVPEDGSGSPGRLDTRDVLDVLCSLVNKSLVVFDEVEEVAGREGRYTLLETVRQYVMEHLMASGELGQLRDRHLGWYQALAERVEAAWNPLEEVRQLARLAGEADNLRVALHWARDTGQAARGLQLAVAWGRLWGSRTFYSEGLSWLEEFLALTREADIEGDVAMDAWRARALQLAATLAIQQTDTATAAALAEQSLVQFRKLGDISGIATALWTLGVVARDQGDMARAVGLLEEAAASWRELGQLRPLAGAVHDLSMAILEQGDVERAAALAQDVIALRRAAGDSLHGPMVPFLLGLVAMEGADAGHAEALLTRSLALFHESRIQRGSTVALFLLGLVVREQGDLGRAIAFSERSLALARELRAGGMVGWALLALGLAQSDAGDQQRAGAALAECVALFAARGMKRYLARGLAGLATVAYRHGAPAWAARLAGAVDALLEGMGVPLPRGERIMYSRTISTTRAALGEDAYLAGWQVGQGQPVAEIVSQVQHSARVSGSVSTAP